MMLVNLVSLRPPVPFGGGKKGARSVVTEAFYDLDDVYDMNFIDFFGGSGLLSQWALEAGFREVVYNDFDDYLGRIRYFNSPRHIEYINWLRWYFYEANGLEPTSRVPDELAEPVRRRVLEEFAKCEEDGLDPSVYEYPILRPVAHQMRPYDSDPRQNRNCIVYTAARVAKSKPEKDNWCAGAKVESTDYRELLRKYPITENTVCSIDPPYPDTESFAYTGAVTLNDIGSLVEECLDKKAKVMVYGNKGSGIYNLMMTKFPTLKVCEFRLATFNKDPFDYLYRNF